MFFNYEKYGCSKMLNDKRIWIGFIVTILISSLIGELNSFTGPEDYTSFMLTNVFSMFVSAAAGAFIARRIQFMVFWIAYFILANAFSYWAVFSVAAGETPLFEIIGDNSGWGGLYLLAGVAGVYIGVYCSRAFTSQAKIQA
ncbi:MAG: hypothetical protein AB8G18_17290 [Gammaproteobacteria bacterium]